MKTFLLNFLYLFLMMPSSFLFGGNIQEVSENIIKKSFPQSVRLVLTTVKVIDKQKKPIEQKVRQKFFRNELYVWKIYQLESPSKLVGRAILDNVYGKEMPITFLVVFDLKGNIIRSAIVKYREAIGGQVAHVHWQKQFIDKNALSSFQVGTDIDGITGATISVHSVTKGIHKLALFYYNLFVRLKKQS